MLFSIVTFLSVHVKPVSHQNLYSHFSVSLSGTVLTRTMPQRSSHQVFLFMIEVNSSCGKELEKGRVCFHIKHIKTYSCSSRGWTSTFFWWAFFVTFRWDSLCLLAQLSRGKFSACEHLSEKELHDGIFFFVFLLMLCIVFGVLKTSK